MFKKIVLIPMLVISIGLIIYSTFFINKNNENIGIENKNIKKGETITGTISSFTINMDKREIKIKDNKNIDWIVNITDNTIFKTKIDLENGMNLKIVGEKNLGKNIITATTISKIK